MVHYSWEEEAGELFAVRKALDSIETHFGKMNVPHKDAPWSSEGRVLV